MILRLALLLVGLGAPLAAARPPAYSCLSAAPKRPSDLVLWVYTDDPCSPETAAHRAKIPNIDVRIREGDLTVIRDLHADMLAAHRGEVVGDPRSPWRKLDAEYSSFEHRFINLKAGAKRRRFVISYAGDPAALAAMRGWFLCRPDIPVFFPSHKNAVNAADLAKLWAPPSKGRDRLQAELFEYCSRVKMTRQALAALLGSTDKGESMAEIDEVELNTKQWADYRSYGRLAYPWEFWRSSRLAREYMLPAPPSGELILLHPSFVFEFGDTSPLTQGVLLDVLGFTRNLYWDSRNLNDGLGKGNFPSVWWWGVAVVMDARVSDFAINAPIPAVGVGISLQGAVYIGDLEGGVTWRPNVAAPFWFIGFEPLGLLRTLAGAV